MEMETKTAVAGKIRRDSIDQELYAKREKKKNEDDQKLNEPSECVRRAAQEARRD